MWFIILVATLCVLAYWKISKANGYWEQLGIKQIKPFFVFGNLGPAIVQKKAMTYLLQDLYNRYPDERYVGVYQFLEPILMIRDPDLIKQVMIKDFDSFPNRKTLVTGDADPFFNKTLTAMSYKDGWHDLRSTLSPAFTSSKMKMMFVLMQDCVKEFIEYLKNQGEETTVELKDIMSRYGSDVIATTAFGVKCNSLKDKDNEMFTMGRDASDFTGLRVFKFAGFASAPALMKLLNVTMLGKHVNEFFCNLIKETIKVREEKKIVRLDMVHLMVEARKGSLKHEDQQEVPDSGFAVAQESDMGKGKKRQITDDDIAAQALLFFFAGSEASSTLMTYAAHELTVNPEIQRKLQSEIDETMEKHNGKMTYEVLLGMKYLDCVISETLRKHPPSALSDRVVEKPYTIEPKRPGEKPVHLAKGSVIWVPTYPIQRDPQHYPEPDKFIPERFNDENKHNIKPYTYAPFGSGPRNCIGSRFALLESKLVIAELVRNFDLFAVPKTVNPVRHSPKNALAMPAEGFWVGMRPRKS